MASNIALIGSSKMKDMVYSMSNIQTHYRSSKYICLMFQKAYYLIPSGLGTRAVLPKISLVANMHIAHSLPVAFMFQNCRIFCSCFSTPCCVSYIMKERIHMSCTIFREASGKWVQSDNVPLYFPGGKADWA